MGPICRLATVVLPAIAAVAVLSDGLAAAPVYRIAVLDDALPGSDRAASRRWRELLAADGHAVTPLSVAEIAAAGDRLSRRVDLLVLPSCGALPVDLVGPVERFVADGGDLLALGAPGFTEILWRSGDRWLSRRSRRRVIDEQPTERVLFDFDGAEDGGIARWQRHSNTPRSTTTKRLIDASEGRALAVRIDDLQGWDTLSAPDLPTAFPPGHALTCLWARGSKTTRKLSLEWRERDGSRWIAVFPVSERWRRVVLAPEDFEFWESTPGRGRPGDHLRPQNAVRLTIGVAWSHTGTAGGLHEYAVDAIGTAPSPVATAPSAALRSPRIEGVSPAYKFYELSAVDRLRARAPWIDASIELPVPRRPRAHHPRPTGKGFGKGREWRWLPLVEALGKRGEWRGAPAGLFVDFEGRRARSVRAAVSIDDADWLRSPAVESIVRATVRRMAAGVFLQEAGCDRFTYRVDEAARVGARVANLGREGVGGISVRFALRRRVDDRKVWSHEAALSVDAGVTEVVVCEPPRTIAALAGGDGLLDLTTELVLRGTVIDRIAHEVGVYHDAPPERRSWVTARDGDFWLDGEKWYVHGINYMPSTGLAADDYPYFEFWMGARSYDPEFIQRDLERCRDIGFNAVSIFIHHRSLAANNLLDILRRCRALGLRVNLSIRPGTPMAYEWSRWEEIIRETRLAEIDTVFAYDIAWEPFFGSIEARRRYDGEWRQWVTRRHGSLASAEAAWGVEGPRHGGALSSPTARELGRDGPHRRMVADYRRFADELIHERYAAAADRIRAIDPHHLVSFRMTVTGDPTFDGSRKMPYDFPGVARSMDFMAPEGYGRVGDWKRIEPGLFTVAWARACAPGKPVLWTEAGVSAWGRPTAGSGSGAGAVDPQRLEFQARYFDDFARMVLASRSSGVVWWWYPGGYRTNERSDYGIIEADGTDRPVTRVLRRLSPRLLAPRDIPTPDVWIDVDRGADARGLHGIWDRVGERFLDAIETGRTPGIRRRYR